MLDFSAATTVEVLYFAVRRAFREAGLAEADLDARVLVAEAVGCEPRNLILQYDADVPDAARQTVQGFAEARLAGKPVGRIIGHREFWGLRFALSEATLEPRPDTETLVEQTLAFCERNGGFEKPWVFADIGTGTGAIAIALLSELPNAMCVAVDLSWTALETARQNAATHEVLERFYTVQSSYLDALGGRFDFVVSNPPYIRSDVIEGLAQEVKLHDPALALDGGTTGLIAYKELIGNAKRILKPNGGLLLEIGFDQADELAAIAKAEAGLPVDVTQDLAGQPRVVAIVFP